MRTLFLLLTILAGLSLLAFAPAEAAPRAEPPCHMSMEAEAPAKTPSPKAPAKAMACCATAALPAPPLLQPRLQPVAHTAPRIVLPGEQSAAGRHPAPELRPPRA
ncbi:hypothetical protein ASG17_10120 [Brevundimonas sp. Leaf363]|uniref:hypothetical protein n=1 Tax=Brevundimonas sp. Leaf363 TaxID=1736353 RepID=UPI0006F381EA|nr:hypothetical protein [Brevundimonas sp. Leaf363]KQS56345.1 hypothetical protein ASG17_10120 [Brevundimonas sp. Leaf363]